GADSFTYAASDGLASSGTAAVTLDVRNDAPEAGADSFTVGHNAALSVAASLGLLANDSDPEADTLTASLGSGPSHGTLTLSANGSFVYTPSAGYHGPDSFTYSVSDGALSAAGTVSLSVTDEAPEAADDLFSVLGSGSTTFSWWQG